MGSISHLPELGADPEREYRLGIMGGTFDPIHFGHLVTAEQAREALSLDLVLFMPAGSPAFKQNSPVTDAEDRYAMTLLATAANPAFDASRFEIDREGITYTIDTLEALRAHYPLNVKLYFITGADAVLDMMRSAWPSLLRLSQLRAPVMTSTMLASASRRAESSSMFAISRFPLWQFPLRTFASAFVMAKACAI